MRSFAASALRVSSPLDDADAIACGVLHTKSCANASDLIRTARGRSFMLTIKQMSEDKKSKKKKKSDDDTAAEDKKGDDAPLLSCVVDVHA